MLKLILFVALSQAYLVLPEKKGWKKGLCPLSKTIPVVTDFDMTPFIKKIVYFIASTEK